MEESSANDQATTAHTKVVYFLEEALRAIFKCLGLETKPQDDPPSSQLEDASSTTKQAVADNSSTADPELADPPSTTETSEVNVAATASIDLVMAVNAPPRPSLTPGSGAQIN